MLIHTILYGGSHFGFDTLANASTNTPTILSFFSPQQVSLFLFHLLMNSMNYLCYSLETERSV